MKADNYWTGVASWLSQGVNAILLGGHHDMTVSARCYINRHKPGWKQLGRLINLIFFWQTDHCAISFAGDVLYAQKILDIQKRNS